MFFKYLNSDGQPAVFMPICQVRTPHVPGLDSRNSRVISQAAPGDRVGDRNDQSKIRTGESGAVPPR
jgi:hypothetical protein